MKIKVQLNGYFKEVEFDGKITREIYDIMEKKAEEICQSTRNVRYFGVSLRLYASSRIGELADMVGVAYATAYFWGKRSDCVCGAFSPVSVYGDSRAKIVAFLKKPMLFDEETAKSEVFNDEIKKAQDELFNLKLLVSQQEEKIKELLAAQAVKANEAEQLKITEELEELEKRRNNGRKRLQELKAQRSAL